MLSNNEKIKCKIKKYGLGFDEIYLDGVYDGIAQRNEEVAKNFLADGFDEELISKCTSLPLDKIRELKKDI